MPAHLLVKRPRHGQRSKTGPAHGNAGKAHLQSQTLLYNLLALGTSAIARASLLTATSGFAAPSATAVARSPALTPAFASTFASLSAPSISGGVFTAGSVTRAYLVAIGLLSFTSYRHRLRGRQG